MATDIHTIRRRNAVALSQAHAAESIAAGVSPRGLETAFAELVGVSGSTWSMARSGARPIGDKLARQMESRAGKPSGWLDEEREPEGLSHAEQQFLSMALKAYRATNAEGRKKLKDALRVVARA